MVWDDLDGDGTNDFVTANHNSDNVGVLPGNGDGTFDAVIQTYAGNGVYGLAVADLDGNGTNDVAAAIRYSDGCGNHDRAGRRNSRGFNQSGCRR